MSTSYCLRKYSEPITTVHLETNSHFLNDVSRGGLPHPSDFCYNICIILWKLVTSLKSDANLLTNFWKANRGAFLFLFEIFASDKINISVTHFANSHQFLKFLVSSFFNCVYKNFIKEFNADCNSPPP